jgi:hypothetical protein
VSNLKNRLILTVILLIGITFLFYAGSKGQTPSGAYSSPQLGATPGGAANSLQFNNGGVLGGSACWGIVSTQIQTLGSGCQIGNVSSGQFVQFGATNILLQTFGGQSIVSNNAFVSLSYGTATNCASSASPAVCGTADAGSVAVAASSATLVVNTTRVNSASQIFLTEDASLGTVLSVTCNTTPTVQPLTVTARSAGTSFTFSNTVPVTNPRCVNYFIMN